MQYCKWDKDLLGGSWLFQSVMTHKLEANETVEYPMTSDNNRFDLGMLRGDQREVAAYILKRLKEWLNYVETYVEYLIRFRKLYVSFHFDIILSGISF